MLDISTVSTKFAFVEFPYAMSSTMTSRAELVRAGSFLDSGHYSGDTKRPGGHLVRAGEAQLRYGGGRDPSATAIDAN